MYVFSHSAQLKFDRLNNPKRIEDYGLSLNESELRSFPAGRKMLADILRIKRKRHFANKFSDKIISSMANRLAKEMNIVLISN